MSGRQGLRLPRGILSAWRTCAGGCRLRSGAGWSSRRHCRASLRHVDRASSRAFISGLGAVLFLTLPKILEQLLAVAAVLLFLYILDGVADQLAQMLMVALRILVQVFGEGFGAAIDQAVAPVLQFMEFLGVRSEEHTSELQSRENLVC